MKNKNLIILFSISVFFIVVCYFYIDRPVVWFLHDHYSRQYTILKFFSDYLVDLIKYFIFGFYIYYFAKLCYSRVSIFESKFIYIANAVIIGQFLKDIFKNIFGRCWPETFRNNNLSLVQDNAYGFYWLKFNADFGSFPSGHATFIFSFIVGLWILFPKYRWLYALLAFLVIAAQLLQYFHFTSDLIAGAILGTFVAVYSCKHYKVKL